MRNQGIDLLRGIAAFGIVGCHLSLAPLTPGGALVRHFCDFNVAVFAVLAGLCMKFSSPQKSDFEIQPSNRLFYIRKRCNRILPTYLFWTVAYLAASAVFQLAERGMEARFGDSVYWVRVIFCGVASCHLWFLIGLLYVQIVIRLFFSKMSSIAMLVIGAGCVVWATLGESWYHVYFLRLFGFVCVGFALRGVDWYGLIPCLRRGGILPPLVGLGILSAVTLIAHVLLSAVIPRFLCDLIAVIPLVLFFEYLGKNCFERISLHPGRLAFLLARRRFGVDITRCLSFVAATSMAVFLVHPIFARVGSAIVGRLASPPYSACVVLIDWFACWLFSMGFAIVAIRTPCLRRVCQ